MPSTFAFGVLGPCSSRIFQSKFCSTSFSYSSRIQVVGSLTVLTYVTHRKTDFILGFVLFARFFPLISIWEIQEGRLHSVQETNERVEGYLPDPKPVVLPRAETEN